MAAVYGNRMYALLDQDGIIRVCKEDLVKLASRCVCCNAVLSGWKPESLCIVKSWLDGVHLSRGSKMS